MSLSLRLFGNIFGEEMVIMILFSIVPFIVPLPMMFLGLITGGLQAFIFVLLSIIYLQGAVAVDHHDDEHDARAGRRLPHGITRRRPRTSLSDSSFSVHAFRCFQRRLGS